MMRTRQEIKKQIVDEFMNNPTLANRYGFAVGESFSEKFSLVSIENIWFEIISYILYFHEQMVQENAKNSRVHNLSWYRDQVLNYLDEVAIKWIDGQFSYEISGLSQTQLSLRKIVKKCAVEERARGGLLIKVSGQNGPLTTNQFNRLKYVVEHIKDAGNRISWRNDPADELKATIDIYIDPTVIDITTGRLLSSDDEVYPVEDAAKGYLNNLEFNGAFVMTKFIDAIQSVNGVKDVHVNNVQWRHGANDWAAIVRKQIPYSGHFSFGNDLTLNYFENDLG